MKRRKCKCGDTKHKKTFKKKGKLKRYTNGEVGRGVKAVVHRGEVILNNPFRKHIKICINIVYYERYSNNTPFRYSRKCNQSKRTKTTKWKTVN